MTTRQDLEPTPEVVITHGDVIVEDGVADHDARRHSLLGLLADAYREASLRDLPMRAIAEILELLRPAATSERGLHAAWDLLDREIANADDAALIAFLENVRRDVQTRLELADMFGMRQRGVRGWREAVAASIAEFRLGYLRTLFERMRPIDELELDERDRVARAVTAALSDRWPDAYEVVLDVASWPSTSRRQCVGLFAIAAEIQIYHLGDLALARRHIEQMREVDPRDCRVATSEGKLHASRLWIRGSRTAAIAAFERAIELDPDHAEPYIALGNLALAPPDSDPDSAASWYRKATRCRSGSSGGWRGLLDLYQRREWFAENETRFLDIHARSVRGDLESVSNAHESLARVYDANVEFREGRPNVPDRYHKALVWYDRAAEAAPTRVSALASKAQLSARAGEIDMARSECLRLMDVSGEQALTTYALVAIEAQAERWADVLSWTRRLLSVRPAWRDGLMAFRGQARLHLGDVRGATWDLMKGLCLEPAGSSATHLQTLTKKLLPDMEAVKRVLGAIRKTRGPQYDGTYHNLLGNRYYEQDRYREAVAEYRAATAASPDDYVLWSNLAAANEQIWTQEPAADSFIKDGLEAQERAARLNAREADELQAMIRRSRVVRGFGTAGLARLRGPAIAPVEIALGSDLHDRFGGDLKLLAILDRAVEEIGTTFGFLLPRPVIVRDRSFPSPGYMVRLRTSWGKPRELSSSVLDVEHVAKALVTELERVIPIDVWDLLDLEQVRTWAGTAAPWDDAGNLLRLWRTFRLLLREEASVAQRDAIIQLCAEDPSRDPVDQLREIHRRLVLRSADVPKPSALGDDWEARLGSFSVGGEQRLAAIPFAELRKLLDAVRAVVGSQPHPVVAIRDQEVRVLATRVLHLERHDIAVVSPEGDRR